MGSWSEAPGLPITSIEHVKKTLPTISISHLKKEWTKAQAGGDNEDIAKKHTGSKKADPRRDHAKQFLGYGNEFVEKFEYLTGLMQ
ncbi:hypothetical protein HGM15179_016801 [Zosterops borbonicus]|uniref:Uncharacterized protein n=1 Tax=Zosterops borbonicus TaxID=364589 RepID=A0A8K1G1Y8_9PASS|nr:hypothetical protein HGM15179_016801 [Zosterops borbonicus]